MFKKQFCDKCKFSFAKFFHSFSKNSIEKAKINSEVETDEKMKNERVSLNGILQGNLKNSIEISKKGAFGFLSAFLVIIALICIVHPGDIT
jgi:hypothetical protein